MMDLSHIEAQLQLDLGGESSLLVDINSGYAESARQVRILRQAADKRDAQQADARARRKAEAAHLAAEAGDELGLAGGDGDSDGDGEAAAAAAVQRSSARMQEIKARVDAALAAGDECVEDEPAARAHVMGRAPQQALPAPQLDGLPLLQQLLGDQRRLLGDDGSGAVASSSPQAAAAAFECLLRDGGPLAACPGEAAARAAFAAVAAGEPELAAMACRAFLAWCGAADDGAGEALLLLGQLSGGADAAASPWPASAADGYAPLAAAEQAAARASIAWLPSDADFVGALTALGCCAEHAGAWGIGRGAAGRQGAAAAAGGQGLIAQAQPLPHAHNLRLLLQLLVRLCRLAGAGRLPLPLALGVGGQGQALARLLLALQLDEAVCLVAKGSLEDACASLLEAAGEVEWSRLAPALLEALAGGLGPSARSSVLLLSQLPLSPRGVVLRQQGALLLLSKLLPGKKAGQVSRGCTSKPDATKLVALLGGGSGSLQSGARTLLAGLELPGKAKGKVAHDTWRLISIIDAADLLLWADVAAPGGSLDGTVADWFVSWMDALEQPLAKAPRSHGVRQRLTELKNAYSFAKAAI